jgi:hypothetical protein
MTGIGTTGLGFFNSYNYTQETLDSLKLQEEVSVFLPSQGHKEYLQGLLRLLNNEDSKKLVALIAEYISKEDRKIKLSEDVETSILSFFVDRA